MSAQIAFNPVLTTTASGSFNTESNGFIQGQAMDDPSSRFRLRSGILSSDETIAMWGGVGIYEKVPGPTAAAVSPCRRRAPRRRWAGSSAAPISSRVRLPSSSPASACSIRLTT